MVNLKQYLTYTCIGIDWLIVGLYSLIIGNYWLRLSKSCHMSYQLNIGWTSVSIGLFLCKGKLDVDTTSITLSYLCHLGNENKEKFRYC